MVIKNKFIVQLGKKPTTFSEVQGQYMGLVKFSYKKFNKIKKIIRDIKIKNNQYKNIFFTDFIQVLINNDIKARAVKIHGNWQEFDKPNDFKIDNYNI
jgi:choline kinase